MDITLSPHAIARAREMGLSFADITEVVRDPEVTYDQSHRGPGRVVAKRGDLSVVYCSDNGVVITVLLNRLEQWDRSVDRLPGR